MTTSLNQQLDEIVRLTQSEPAQVIVEALRHGMKKVYLDAVLRAYLQGKISRKDAAQKAGLHVVLRAEEEHQVMLEDFKWGLGESSDEPEQ